MCAKGTSTLVWDFGTCFICAVISKFRFSILPFFILLNFTGKNWESDKEAHLLEMQGENVGVWRELMVPFILVHKTYTFPTHNILIKISMQTINILSLSNCCIMTSVLWVSKPVLRPREKRTLFYGHDRPRFSILVDFFKCKTSPFWSKSKKIWLKVFGNNWKSFPKFFSKKLQTYEKFYCFLGESFLPPERK